jgi:UDP-2-acetamido-3-amino-2,3-dideoxy-glucuronate N-acetyltransferase
LAYFKHPQAIVESDHIGDKTRVWAFAHILPGAVIGADCNICDHTFIENQVVIGDRVTIKCGVQVWDGITIHDDVFIGPNVTFTNDRFPRSQQHLAAYPQTIVHASASIGANATILPGIQIGRSAMVGAGAVVTRDVPANAIVVGNPARIHGYVTARQADAPDRPVPVVQAAEEIPVRGVRLYELPLVKDLRGSLTFAELDGQLPFPPRRFFLVYDVPSKEIRGEHAHRQQHQFLVCLRGSCAVLVDDGSSRAEVTLDRPTLGLHVPPMVWAVEYKYSPDAALLVFASAEYDAADYIRDYEAFLSAVMGGEPG